MISSIKIKNIGSAESISVDFINSFNVITGDSGSGKSVIVKSLVFLFYNKIEKQIIQNPKKEAEVVVDLKEVSPISKDLKMLVGISEDDKSNVSIKRVYYKSKSDLYINHLKCEKEEDFATLISKKIEINSQWSQVVNLNSSSHREFLDLYIGVSEDVKKIAEIYSKIVSLQMSISKKESLISEVQNDLDYHNLLIGEIESKIEYIREEDGLIEKRKNIDSIGKNINRCRDISSSLQGALDKISSTELFISKAQVDISNSDKWNEFYTDLDSNISNILAKINRIQSKVSGVLYEKESEVAEYDEIDFKLREINHLTNKYKCGSGENLIKVLKDSKLKIDQFEEYTKDIDSDRKELDKLIGKYTDFASNISKIRSKGSDMLSSEIEKKIGSLMLDHINIKVNVSTNKDLLSSHGYDSVKFLFKIKSKENIFKDIKQLSGGELARFNLALKCVIVEKLNINSIIFDEIDSGVSGKMVDAMGREMEYMSKFIQVISITHSPQIAGRGERHIYVYKISDETKSNQFKVLSQVKILSKEERAIKIAEMVAGEDGPSSHSVQFAKAMIKNKDN